MIEYNFNDGSFFTINEIEFRDWYQTLEGDRRNATVKRITSPMGLDLIEENGIL